MDISHKYCYTNFEQLNIDFLLESVADHSNKITQLWTDLQTEIDTRIRDVEILTEEDANITAFANQIQADLNQEIADRTAAVAAEAAAREAAIAAEAATRAGDVEILTEEDANLTAFANQIQADLNQEIADRAAADAAVAPVLFHLSYSQGGVLDCLPDEANDIMKAFDTDRRALAQNVDGTWYERINLVDRTTMQEAYFVRLTANSMTWISGGIIKLTHIAADDTHTFVASGFSVDTAPTVIHITSSSNTPDDQATYTTADDLWDVQFMDKNTYIELTCPGNYPTRYYTRSSSIISDVGSSSYSATFIFSYWDSSIRYDLEIALSKTDVTDPSTWTATITGRKTSFDTV